MSCRISQKKDLELDSGEEWQKSSDDESPDTSTNPSPIPSNKENENVDEIPNIPHNEPNWRETYDPIDIDPYIQNTGTTHNLGPNANELNFFKLLFNDEMIQNLVPETNRYITQHEPDQNWSNTNNDEISAFLGASKQSMQLVGLRRNGGSIL